MRLLRTSVSVNHSFEVQYFQDDNIPKFAILSHTWDEDEVTFQDLEAGRGQAKKGFQKIRNCCRIARDAGYEYVWIDTCCI